MIENMAAEEIRRSRPILIADPDEAFVQSIKTDPHASQNPPLLAANGKEAQLLLSDSRQPIAGLFVNPRIASTDVLSVIRCCHMHRPATPIYLIHDGTSPYTKEQLKVLPIQEWIKKPVTYTELLHRVGPVTFLFDPSSPEAAGGANSDALDAEVKAQDDAFLPIRAADFLGGTKSFFDVYVRLGSGRFLKILQAGDVFTPDRVAAYLRKGLTHFYLRKEAQERYLSYCDQLTTSLLSKKEIPVEIKMSQTLNQGEETFSFLKHHGLSEGNLQHAHHFVSHVHTLVLGLNPEEQDLLKGFMSDIAAYEHGVSTAMLSAMMIKNLQITGERPSQIIGLSCMLHDIGLYQLDEKVREENENIMTEGELASYKTHPALGAQILKQIRSVDPVVAQAVSQHHERRDKGGFPLGLGHGAINRVAEIVGICDEFAKLIKRAQSNPEIYILQRMEEDVFPGFSDPVTKAFRMAFFIKEKK